MLRLVGLFSTLYNLISLQADDPARYRDAWESIRNCSGVVIPGGFGKRGVEGKILAAKYCRESKKPFLGICLGMQVRQLKSTLHAFYMI